MPIILPSGLDGHTPVYEPNSRWCWWRLGEIYDGTQGENRYVPKVDDYVVDPLEFVVYIVVSVDPVTFESTLREIKPKNSSTNLSTEDILFGVGPGTQADTYRIYLDSSVTPHVLAVDARLKVGGTMCSYAKIFRGANVSSTGKVISRLYDQSGTMLSQNVPLELAAIDSHTNHSIRVVAPCYTNETMVDGEIATVVFYDDRGHVVSKRQLLVENTSFIRNVSSSQKYISHISLESPFMSATTESLIEFPINIPLAALNLMGVVHYSDGSTLKMPVNGAKFRLYGMDQYVSTIVGQRMELVLSYALSTDETVYGAVTSDNKYVTAPYNLVTTRTDGSYTVKLFGYPVWVDGVQGYRMEWYLYNLDRNVVFRVTPHVRFDSNNSYFDPLGYGILQRMSVSINLKDVSGAFRSYIHTQSIDIVLRQPGGDPRTNWTIGFETAVDAPLYGTDLSMKAEASTVNSWTVNISSDIATYEEWINRLYIQTYPLMDRSVELAPPTPNYFAIVTGGSRTEFDISQWNTNLTIGGGVIMNGTAFVQFFKRTPNGDIQLAVAGLTIRPMV